MARRSAPGGRRAAVARQAALGAVPAPAPVRTRRPPAGPVEVVVESPCDPADVVSWFTDGHRWVRFQGRSAQVEPVVGGRIRLELGDGVVMAGRFTELERDRVAFTWGRPGDPILPADSSRVTVLATPAAGGGCEILLRHDGLPDQGVADAHRSGWRYHLVRLSVVAAGATGETETIDLFLAAASEGDADARRGLLDRTCGADVEVADGAGRVLGTAQLSDHFGRAAVAVPTRRLVRTGPVTRVGAIVRCPYAVVDRGVGGPVTLESGEIVAALDRTHRISARSLFG